MYGVSLMFSKTFFVYYMISFDDAITFYIH